MGIGWLWFSALQVYLLPLFLWGTPWSGGGASVFILILLLGFTLLSLIWKKNPLAVLENKPFVLGNHQVNAALIDHFTDFRLSNISQFAHLFCLLLAFQWVIFPPPLNGALAYLPVVSMALIALIQGIFWSGAMLCLSPYLACGSFVAAAACAALLSFLLSFIPTNLYGIIFCFFMLLSWRLAWKLRYLLKKDHPQLKRSRGRPAKKEKITVAKDWKFPAQDVLCYLILASAFFFMGINISSYGYGFSAMPWLSGSTVFLGALAGMFLCKLGNSFKENDQRGQTILKNYNEPLDSAAFTPLMLICAALLFQGASRVIFPEILFTLSSFLVGLICSAVFSMFSGLPADLAWRRVPIILAIILLLGNLGLEAAIIAESFFNNINMLNKFNSPSLRVVGLFELSLALILIMLLIQKMRQLNLKAVENAPSSKTLPVKKKFLALNIDKIGLTSREKEILHLASQDYDNKEIATFLDIKEATVRFHIRNIYQKTGLNQRDELLNLVRR